MVGEGHSVAEGSWRIMEDGHREWSQRVIKDGHRGLWRFAEGGHRGLQRPCLHLVAPSNHILSG